MHCFFYSRLQTGLAHACGEGIVGVEEMRLAGCFQRSQAGAGPPYRPAGQRGCRFLIGGDATVDKAAIESCDLKTLSGVFVYKPLDSSQTLKLQTRQAISNFHQRGVRKKRSP